MILVIILLADRSKHRTIGCRREIVAEHNLAGATERRTHPCSAFWVLGSPRETRFSVLYHLRGFEREGSAMSPRLTDWSLALAAGVAFGSGVVSLVSGRPELWFVFALHGMAGLWLLLLLWSKFARVL